MSQAALNTRNRDEEAVSASRRNNGTRLAIVFLLAVLCTVFVSGCGAGVDGRCAAVAVVETVLTGDRHYTRNDDIRTILARPAPL